MNDPGYDQRIAETSETIKHEYGDKENADSEMEEEEEEKSFLLPARWWYASTAFPLIAGTFGPMANTFSICALAENWRVDIPPGGTEQHGIDIKDPTWLIEVNAVSLVCALAANLALLLNMAQRLSFRVAQPITIIGFWLAAVLLIALIAVAAHDLRAPGVQDQALTQAYYYAIFAAGIYQIISSLMMITMYGAVKGHYSKEFKLTISQRTLMLQTISFMTYLLLGALIYSKLEGWKFLDAVYWADFTLLTIGIGDDYTPKTHTGRALLFPFAIGGIIILGLVVGSVRSLVLERGKKKMSARMIEKIRRRVVERIEKAKNSNDRFFHKIRGLDKKTSCVLSLDPHENKLSEKRRREAEFNAMRQVQNLATKERKWISLIVSGLAWLFLWLVGAAVFSKAEKNQQWSYFESIYFSYTTLLTIGYGDFQPESNSGKPFFVFWSLLAVPTLTILISNMGDTVIAGIKDLTIYLGEITVLPSEEGSVRQRVQFGITKVTGGKLNLKALQDSNDGDIEEQPPGLIHMPHRQHQKPEHDKEDVEAINKLTSDFAEAEKLDEDDARKHGDKLAENIHHYRHILIGEIQKVYDDVNAPIPKKYTYDEWSYYLGLLGEDEGYAKYHRKAPLKGDHADLKPVKDETTAPAKQETKKEAEEAAGHKHAKNEADDKSKGIKPWSWIGNRSPLMGDKEESVWILEKLFLRLEDELQYEKKLAAKLRKKQKENSNTFEQDNLQAIK